MDHTQAIQETRDIATVHPARHDGRDTGSWELHMLTFINSDAAKSANLPFSQAVRSGDVVYLSGSIGNAPGKMALVPGGIEAESRQMMQNIESVLKECGLGFEHVFKAVVYLADMAEWGTFNKIYTPYFRAGRYPARTAIGAHQLILGARVEMECWADASGK